MGVCLAIPRPAAADYGLDDGAWNGGRDLIGAAEAAGVTLDSPAVIDVDALEPSDGLLIVHPTRSLPTVSLSRFVRAGGRLAVADDYGRGQELLSTYGIVRAPPTDTETRVRGNPELPLALPRVRHPLTRDVRALVTNHPQSLRHDELRPIFGFGDGPDALVLAGAVERGRLVAIGDPSVFINNMLQFRDNRRFAENLFAYLDGERGGRVYLVTPAVRLEGRAGSRDASLEGLRAWLDDFARADAPPVALILMSVMLVALLLIFAISNLPRRSPYLKNEMLARAGGGGVAGRVAFFERRRSELLHPLLVMKYELEGALIRELGLRDQGSERPLLGQVLAAAEARGMPAPLRRELRALLLELDDLRRRADLPPGPPRPSPKDVRRMVHSAERILAALEPSAPRTSPDT